MSDDNQGMFSRARDRIAKRLWSGEINKRHGIPASELASPGTGRDGFQRTTSNIQKEKGERKAQVPEHISNPVKGRQRTFNPFDLRRLSQSELIQSVENTIISDVDAVPWSVVPIDESKERDVSDSTLVEAEDALNDLNPNPETFVDINEMFVTDLLEIGNCVATTTQSIDGRVAEAVPLDAGMFTADWNENRILQGFYQYPQSDNSKWGDPIAFDRTEVLWGTYNPTTRRAGLYGYSPTEMTQQTINILGGLVEKEITELEEGMPSGLISLIGDEWNQRNYENFKEYWQENVKGHQLSHPVAEGEADFVPFNMTYKELQVLDRQSWYAKLVGSCFGVPVSENGLAIGEGMNRATDVSQRQRYKQKTLQSLLTQLEDIWTYQYLHRHFSEDIRLKFDVGKDLMEKEKLSSIHDTQLKNGSKTINEIREQRGEDTVPWGDEPFHLKTYTSGGSSNASADPATNGPPSENGENPIDASESAREAGLEQDQTPTQSGGEMEPQQKSSSFEEQQRALAEEHGLDYDSLKDKENPFLPDDVKESLKKDASLERITKPFAGFDDWDECVRTMQRKGHDEESARKICGSLESQSKAVSAGKWLPESAEPPTLRQIEKSFRGNTEWRDFSFQPSAINDLEAELDDLIGDYFDEMMNQLQGNQHLLRQSEGATNGIGEETVQKSMTGLFQLIRETIGLEFAQDVAELLAEHKATQVFEAEDEILSELREAGVSTEGMDLSATRDRVVERIENRTLQITRPISERLESDLRGVLRTAWVEGQRITEIEENIEELRAGWTGYQAERLARDQIGKSAKEGRLGYAKDTSEQVGGWDKEWMDSNDHRVRESHEEMDQTKVPLDEPFIVDYSYDGGPKRVPEDYPGESKWGIQCRCDYKLTPHIPAEN